MENKKKEDTEKGRIQVPDSKDVWADRRSRSSAPYLPGRLVSGIRLAGLESDQREPGQP